VTATLPSIVPPATPTPPPARTGRLRPRHDALGVLLVATATLYLWGLSASGWANGFYSAAAQAAGVSWTAWFFGSSDAANWITVDKTPAALWVDGLAVRLFGLSSWSVLAPQAVLGVATVALLYASVRRTAPAAGLASGLATGAALFVGAALAVTPAAVLIFRFNNPDALLTLLLVAAAYATLRAVAAAPVGCCWPRPSSGSGSSPRCCRRSWCCPRWRRCGSSRHRSGRGGGCGTSRSPPSHSW